MTRTISERPAVAVDVGSTFIKIASIAGPAYRDRVPRDRSVEVGQQVEAILDAVQRRSPSVTFRICSSANGGIRVGMISLTERFSGRASSRIAMSAGANVVYQRRMDRAAEPAPPVDALIVSGGADVGSERMRRSIAELSLEALPHRTLIFAGDRHVADLVRARAPEALVLPNILGRDLHATGDHLTETIRSLYLRDLVDKQGIARLQERSTVPIWPTPAVASLGYRMIVEQRSARVLPLPLLVLDIGGATTDIHFGAEAIDIGEGERLDAIETGNRYAFTGLGSFPSRPSTLDALARHTRLISFLEVVVPDAVERIHAALREDPERDVPEELALYACFFLALDGLSSGIASGVRVALGRISGILVTGGASQRCRPQVLRDLVAILMPQDAGAPPQVTLDADYDLWVDGIRAVPPIGAAAAATDPVLETARVLARDA